MNFRKNSMGKDLKDRMAGLNVTEMAEMFRRSTDDNAPNVGDVPNTRDVDTGTPCTADIWNTPIQSVDTDEEDDENSGAAFERELEMHKNITPSESGGTSPARMDPILVDLSFLSPEQGYRPIEVTSPVLPTPRKVKVAKLNDKAVETEDQAPAPSISNRCKMADPEWMLELREGIRFPGKYDLKKTFILKYGRNGLNEEITRKVIEENPGQDRSIIIKETLKKLNLWTTLSSKYRIVN